MSLRGRLTLFYTALVGGIFLLFGAGVYKAVSLTITNQLDDLLKRTADTYIKAMVVNEQGQLMVNKSLLPVDLPADVTVQVWGRNNSLLMANPDTGNSTQPMDRAALFSPQQEIRDVTIGSIRMRVLTVVLVVGSRSVGHLQAGTKQDLVIASPGFAGARICMVRHLASPGFVKQCHTSRTADYPGR